MENSIRSKWIGFLLALLLPCLSSVNASQSMAAPAEETPLLSAIESLMGSSEVEREAAFLWVEENWQESFVPALVDTLRVAFWRRQAGFRDTSFTLIGLLESETGQALGADLSAWFGWIWKRDLGPHPEYASIKSYLYAFIDPKFAGYFSNSKVSTIRLSEVRWGGVVQDGIPSLRAPKMIAAEQAGYLADTDVVFGIQVNGDVRAYPKRILAWHEMFTDQVGGLEVTGVY